MTSLPPISTLPNLPTSARASILDLLFEPCVQLHTLSVSTLSTKPAFKSYPALITAVETQLLGLFRSASTSDSEWLEAILCAHPRLGEKKVESELSRKEQAQLGAKGPEAEAEAEKLRVLNEDYEGVFPGLRYVVFVNGRSRPVIMEDMQKRIDRGDIYQEKLDAIKAMCDIACDRARKLGG